MHNQELAKLFFQIADFLELDGVAFKPFAYRKVALVLENFEKDVAEIYRQGGLEGLRAIPGVGEGIAKAIEEYLKTGKIKQLKELKDKLPLKVEELLKVEGLGPRKIKVLYEKLGIKNIKDLEKSAKAHKISPLFGFGEKTEANILQSLEFLKQSKGRFLLGEVLPVARIIIKRLQERKEVLEVSYAGSLRRQKETIGDIDILVVSKDEKKTAEFFVSMPEVEKVWAQGDTKCSVRFSAKGGSAFGGDADLRLVPAKSFGSALQYFTGSKEHNIATRKIAIEKGLKLSEYGLFRGNKQIAGKTEKDVYKALGLEYIDPEIRENDGEIQASLEGKLPKLVELKDVKGDLHVHTNFGLHGQGGVTERDSIETLCKKAVSLGYEYIGISDHTEFLKIESGLTGKQLLKQHEYIKNLKFKNLKILHGCETNILEDGSVDISDDVLEKLDYVIAGVHSSMKIPRAEMTKRIIKAMENPNIDIISHPTGRLIGQRDEYEIDFDKILETAKRTGTILEINSSPFRLDLNGFYIRRAISAGVKLIMNTDSHKKDQMDLMEYGVGQARKGWAQKQDIINTSSAEELLNNLK